MFMKNTFLHINNVLIITSILKGTIIRTNQKKDANDHDWFSDNFQTLKGQHDMQYLPRTFIQSIKHEQLKEKYPEKDLFVYLFRNSLTLKTPKGLIILNINKRVNFIPNRISVPYILSICWLILLSIYKITRILRFFDLSFVGCLHFHSYYWS